MKGKKKSNIPCDCDEPACIARRAIDENIKKLKIEIRTLKTSRNELASISILPPEVLSRIFVKVRDRSEYNLDAPKVQWIRCVGHVCHQWREVALSCPSLWAKPVFIRPALAKEMILRSKMAPLTIELLREKWTQKMLEQLEASMTQISRFQSIHLVMVIKPQVLKTIVSSLSQPTPLLEEIILTYGSSSVAKNPLQFPIDALADADRLRKISLYDLRFSWESAMFKHSGVTTLRLENRDENIISPSSFDQMMDALSYLPNLRTLDLQDVIPPCTTSSGDGRILEFKSLKRLDLSGKAADCIFFLHHIRYPSRTKVRLNCTSTEIESCTTIFSLVGQNIRDNQIGETGTTDPPLTFKSADLLGVGTGAATVTLYDKVERKRSIYSSLFSDSVIEIRFVGPHIAGQHTRRFLAELNEYFDLYSLVAIFMRGTFSHQQINVIRESLGKLPSLEFIQTSGSLHEICSAIGDIPGETPTKKSKKTKNRNASHKKIAPVQTPPPVVAFAALRSLSIKDVDFRQHKHPENMIALVDMLMKRCDMDAPIDALNLEGCRGVWTPDKRRLGELVVDLFVDGWIVRMDKLNSDIDDCFKVLDYSDVNRRGSDFYSDEYDDDDYSDNSSYVNPNALPAS